MYTYLNTYFAFTVVPEFKSTEIKKEKKKRVKW